ncbi:DUF2085 domain-containing protein [Chloroflexi bacterium TSY]|nr:DUF2085 domain-containing protein [Chloroflexi bacterium TSY]
MVTSENKSQTDSLASQLIIWITSHWLLLINVVWGTYITLPFLAPLFMALGLTVPARLIYGLYSVACHQLPDHSYFLFGDLLIPDLASLEANGMPRGVGLLEQRQFIGNEQSGYKVAICQRDVAIYGSVLIAGILYGRWGRGIRPLSWILFGLLLIPIAIDGTTQLVGLRESNWWLRTLTGSLFGIACVWLAYPHVENAMNEIRKLDSCEMNIFQI